MALADLLSSFSTSSLSIPVLFLRVVRHSQWDLEQASNGFYCLLSSNGVLAGPMFVRAVLFVPFGSCRCDVSRTKHT